jgi:hypothetical protein
MLSLLSILTFATAALAVPAANPPLAVPVQSATASATAVGPNPTEVYINSIAFGGSGCPQNTVGYFLSADKKT